VILYTMACSSTFHWGDWPIPPISPIFRVRTGISFPISNAEFFKGSLEPVGSILLPNLAIVALFLAPFLDRGKLKKVTQRTTAIGVVTLAAVAWGALTFAAIKTTPPSVEEQASSPVRPRA